MYASERSERGKIIKSAIQISVTAPSGAQILQFSWLVLGILPNRTSQTSMTSKKKKKLPADWGGGGGGTCPPCPPVVTPLVLITHEWMLEGDINI